MVKHFLQDHICKYSTPKLVVVRDSKLLAANCCLKVSVLLYVLLWTFSYKCEHLIYEPIVGFSRLTLWEPTHHCDPRETGCRDDFRKLTELQYCKEYNGNVTNPLIEQFPCIFKDGFQLTHAKPIINEMFVPTMVRMKEGQAKCDVGSLSCEKAFIPTQENYTSYYIADIERFTVMISHHTERLTNTDCPKIMRETSTGHLRPHGSSHFAIPKLTSEGMDPRSDAYPSAVSIPFGDIISIGDLAKLSEPDKGSDLDAFPSIYSMKFEKRTRRRSGGMLRVNIEYTNFEYWHPFGGGPKTYFMSTAFAPFAHMTEVTYNDGDGYHQVLHEDIGLLLAVRVYGRYYRFCWWQFVKMFSSVVALLLAATVLVDWFMQYSCHAKSRHYARLKRQQPYGFTDGRRNGTKLLHQHAKSMKAPDDLALLAILVNFEERLDHLDGLNVDGMESSSEDEENYEDLGKKENAVQNLYIFRHATADRKSWTKIARQMEGGHYEYGEDVIIQGSTGNSLFIIAHGEVSITVGGQEVDRKSKHGCFGERALLSDEPRAATVTVDSDSAYIWSISKDVIFSVMNAGVLQSMREEINVQDKVARTPDLKTVGVIRHFGNRHDKQSDSRDLKESDLSDSEE